MTKMIQNNLVFDEVRDVQPVDQFGYVDLVKSFQNGYVAGDVEAVAEYFNDIDDPASIIGKPKDCFEAMRMQDMVVANAKKGTKSVESAPAKASPESGKN